MESSVSCYQLGIPYCRRALVSTRAWASSLHLNINVSRLIPLLPLTWQPSDTKFGCDSESMEPAFARGDILFLTNFASDSYEIGDIPVYKMYVATFPPHPPLSLSPNHSSPYTQPQSLLPLIFASAREPTSPSSTGSSNPTHPPSPTLTGRPRRPN